jgi:microcystin-dependent protein
MSTASVPPGTIMLYTSAAAPQGYLLCHGQSVLIADYSALYSVIGSTFKYSKPSYSGQFYVPDMRGLFVRGVGENEILPVSGPTSIGTLQESSVQEHSHQYYRPQDSITCTEAPYTDYHTVWDNITSAALTGTTLYDPNGDVISSSETRPANISLNYIIKY